MLKTNEYVVFKGFSLIVKMTILSNVFKYFKGMKKKQKRSPKKRRESFVRRERKDSETSTKAVEIPVEKKRGKNVEKLRTAEQSDNMTACRLVKFEMLNKLTDVYFTTCVTDYFQIL